MANKAKNSIRLSSLLLAVIMLVFTVFAGTAQIQTKAETTGAGNVIKIQNYKYVTCGQNVTVEVGKTYVYSFYYDGPTLFSALIYDGDAVGSTEYQPTKVTYDAEYNKATYEFTAPADATPADEAGKVVLYLGVQTLAEGTYYFYAPCVYAADDPTRTNLFVNSDFTGPYTLAARPDGHPDWYRHYSYAPITKNFTMPSLESEGGMALFEKSDADRNVVQMAANSNEYFGQRVYLTKGSTYTFSYKYTGWDLGYLLRIEDGTYNNIESGVIINYDNDVFKKSIIFTVPTDYDTGAADGMTVWVGVRGPRNPNVSYLCDFKLCSAAAPDVNLFQDSSFYAGGSDFDSVWRKPSNANLVKTYFTKVSLETAGGMDIFNKTDADRNTIQAAAGSSEYFGQRVYLIKGNTYTFSYKYTGWDSGYLLRIEDGTYNNIEDGVIVNYDNDWFKKSITFTVPVDYDTGAADGMTVWVGVRGPKNPEDSYYYDFKLCNVSDPEINLFQDHAFMTGGVSIDSVWKKPSNAALVTANFSKISLDDAGGMDIFKKADSDRFAIKMLANATEYFGQRVDLTKGSTYTFSYKYTGWDAGYLLRIEDGTWTNIEDGVNVAYDSRWNEKRITFTVPADYAGDTDVLTIWVGIRGPKNPEDSYYYDFKLFNVSNPEVNLFKDNAFMDGGSSIDSVWKKPSNAVLASANFEKVTLDTIGGVSAFLLFEVKCDLTGDGIIDVRDLVRMKKFSIGAIDELPEGTGNLNLDTNVADAADLLLLKKEILK